MTRKRRTLVLTDDSCRYNHRPLKRISRSGSRECAECRRLRRRFRHMHQRCYNESDSHYKDYGARGIQVCDRWHEYDNWYWDFGHKLVGNDLTMDRKNNDGDYSPDNVRLATVAEQNRNQRRSVLLTYDGMTLNKETWIQRYGIPKSRPLYRLKDGETDMEYVLFDVRVEHTPGGLIISKGRVSQNLSNWCRSLGCSIRTVEDRVYKFGWSYAQALGFAPRKGKLRPPPTKKD